MTEQTPEPRRRGSGFLAFLAILGFVGAGTFAYLWLAARSDETAPRRERTPPEAAASRPRPEAAEAANRADLSAEALEQATARIRSLEEEARDLRARLEEARRQGIANEEAGRTRLEQAFGRVAELEAEVEGLEKRAREGAAAAEAGRGEDRAELAEREREIGRLRAEKARLEAELAGARQAARTAPPTLETSPRAGAPMAALAEDLAGELRRLAPESGRPDASTRDALQAAVGTSPALLPALVTAFADGGQGTLAVAHVGRLRGPDVATYLAGVAASGRQDEDFVAEAASTLLRIARPDELRRILTTAHEHASPTMRLLAVEASGGTAGGGDGAVLGAILRGDDGRAALLALAKLRSGGPRDRAVVLDALEAGALAPAVREAAITGLVHGPVEDLPALVRLAARRPEVLAAAAGESVEASRRGELLGDLLAAAPDPGLTRWLASLLEAPEDAERSALVARVVTDPSLQGGLIAAARRGALVDPELARTATLLPPVGTLILDPAKVLALAAAARPVHVPFLLPNVERVPLPDRLAIATRLHEFGHPEGLAVLDRARGAKDPAVRAAVLETAGRLGAAPVAGLVEAGLGDSDPRVAGAALRLAARAGLPLTPAVARRLLSELGPPESDLVLEGLDRHAAADEVRAVAWELLGAAEPTPGEERLARWFLAREDVGQEVVLSALEHPRAAVRAEAAAALARRRPEPTPEVLAALEARVRDDDPVVRTRVAPPLGGLGHDLARTALVLLARDPEAVVREAAVTALGRQEPYHVVPVLRRSVRDPDPTVRNAARLALVDHAIYDEVPGLIEDVDDPVLGPRTRRRLDGLLGLEGTPAVDDYRRAFEAKRDALGGGR